MEPFVYMMLIGGIVFVLFALIAVINFGFFFKREDAFEKAGNRVMVHIGSGLLSGFGFLSLVGGFIWFLIDKYI